MSFGEHVAWNRERHACRSSSSGSPRPRESAESDRWKRRTTLPRLYVARCLSYVVSTSSFGTIVAERIVGRPLITAPRFGRWRLPYGRQQTCNLAGCSRTVPASEAAARHAVCADYVQLIAVFPAVPPLLTHPMLKKTPATSISSGDSGWFVKACERRVSARSRRCSGPRPCPRQRPSRRTPRPGRRQRCLRRSHRQNPTSPPSTWRVATVAVRCSELASL